MAIRTNSIQFWLAVLAIFALAVIYTPKTKWIIFTQLKAAMAFSVTSKMIPSNYLPAFAIYPTALQIDRIARRHPQDFDVQLGAAIIPNFDNWFGIYMNCNNPCGCSSKCVNYEPVRQTHNKVILTLLAPCGIIAII